MARVAMPPQAIDQPPLLMREARQKPSGARFGAAKGVGARVPIAGVQMKHPVMPRPVKLPDHSKCAAEFPAGESLSKSIALLQDQAMALDQSNTVLCSQCSLPLGDQCYSADGKGEVHGECMAQLLLQRFQKSDDERNQEDEHEKCQRREEFGIGWKHDRIPRNEALQSKLKDTSTLQAMTCLVMSEDGVTVHLGATNEPLAAVNLEYLSIALQVRRKEGVEPLFSLDPVKPTNVHQEVANKQDAQMKRFEPEWLAGTSVGEVLFQADYHLKELSMGECQQPVIGMKSVLDHLYYEDAKDDSNLKWSGREWFMVRKAEVKLSEDGVLIPVVKMGVEAREQLYLNGSMIDAPISRSDHPMVKYADSFTQNFDLIAERSSVIFHLRELAKASVLAKYLDESGTLIPDSIFSLGGEVEDAYALEIPQLWNERLHSKIHVKNGEIVGNDKNANEGHAIYGGVQFGLDKFQLSHKPVGMYQPNVKLQAPSIPSGAVVSTLGKFQAPRSVAVAPGIPSTLNLFSTVRQPKVPGLGAPVSAERFFMPGQLQAVNRFTPGVTPDLEKYMMTRPSLLFARPPAPVPDMLALGPGELPSALNKFRVTPMVPEAKMPGMAALQLGLQPVPGVPVRDAPAPMTRSAQAGRRQLLAGGVLARQAIPPTVSVAPIGVGAARASLTTADPKALGQGVALSMAMPALGQGMVARTPSAGLNLSIGIAAARAPSAALNLSIGIAAARAPQGVDLNLNQFSLDSIDQPAEGNWMCDPQSEVAAAAMADVFWSCVDGGDVTVFEKEDLTLFKNVFNAKLSDRRAEGECFTTPDTSSAYICKLHNLVKAEEEVRQQRKDHFFSTSFLHDNPGPLFPISWAPTLEVDGARASEHVLSQGRSLQARADYKEVAEVVLKSASPAFQKKTEEGLLFRIYRVGSLEVRTTEEDGAEEFVGAVFTVHSEADSLGKVGATRCARGGEKISKATEYVHKTSIDFHYYVVFETECGNTILSEQSLLDGTVTWEENVKDLEVRNGLAKVVRFAECGSAVTVQHMKVYCGQFGEPPVQHVRSEHGKAYATSAFAVAVGQVKAA